MPMGNFQGTYAPEKVVVTIGGVIITGFSDGDSITAKYDEDRYMMKVGIDGEVGRSKNASKAGTVEVVLSGTSMANEELSVLFNLDQISGISPALPIGVADLSGRTVVAASKAWIKTAPDIVFGKEIGDRTWTFACADMTFFVGGNG